MDVYALIKPFVDICLLNIKPQDLPASSRLLLITLLAYYLVGIALSMPVYGFAMSTMEAALEVFMLVAYTRIVLTLNAHGVRYHQTLTALAGAGAVLGLVALPLSYSVLQPVTAYGSANALTVFAYLLLMGWLLIVYGHIFRHALSSGLGLGMLVGLGYIVLSTLAIESLFRPLLAS
jgi:hypothetical protein